MKGTRMSSKRMRRVARKGRERGTVEIESAAGRWILLPGGGFGLQRPWSFDGRTPA
jgi:hypothetical protein